MTPVAETLNPALEDKLSAFLVKLLKLGPDVSLTPEGDLIQQIGMDSIEAFDAVATLHELLEAAIPDDFDPDRGGFNYGSSGNSGGVGQGRLYGNPGQRWTGGS